MPATLPVVTSMAVTLPVMRTGWDGPPPVKKSRGLASAVRFSGLIVIRLQLSITGMYQSFSSRIVGGRRPVLAAHVAGQNVGDRLCSRRRRHRRIVGLHRLAGSYSAGLPVFGIDALGPGHLLHERHGPKELAVCCDRPHRRSRCDRRRARVSCRRRRPSRSRRRCHSRRGRSGVCWKCHLILPVSASSPSELSV